MFGALVSQRFAINNYFSDKQRHTFVRKVKITILQRLPGKNVVP